MLNYIVLGQVPGTDYYLNFTSVLILYALVLLLAAAMVFRQFSYEMQPSAQSAKKRKIALSRQPYEKGALVAASVSLAILVIVKFSQAGSSWQQKYLSSINQYRA